MLKQTILATEKVKRETGLSHVFASLNILTPYGQKQLRGMRPFMPGEEARLEEEFERIQKIGEIIGRDDRRTGQLKETLMMVKDNTLTIEKSADSVLTVVELFELKNLLLQMEKLRKMHEIEHFPPEYVPFDVTPLLDHLDPDGGRISTFFIYDSFSERLADLRGLRKDAERKIRKTQKQKALQLRKQRGIALTPKFELQVNKADRERIKAIEEIPELEKSAEDYMTITWRLAADEETDALARSIEEYNQQIEVEEYEVRRVLSGHVSEFRESLLESCRRIGELDLAIAKAGYARERKCCTPQIVPEHRISFAEGRHLQVEEILKRDRGEYCPISIDLEDGVTCITGANMGGKTISLKLVGLIILMAQYGLPVPCVSAELGLCSSVRILIGDSQSIERGLSSFGSEMEELRAMLAECQDRSLLLIDEIASGTNPSEGLALTRAIVDHLKEEAVITLITTHFERVAEGDDVVNLQVTGLADADLSQLDVQLKAAGSQDRVNVIRRFMDYRLKRVDGRGDVPRDALHIAQMLGIDEDIIERAKEYLN